MVSMHTSPDAQPGAADAGGMNVAILATALELAARGVEVDLLTRAMGGPSEHTVAPGVTIHSLAAGARGSVATLAVVADEFGEAVARLSRESRYDLIHSHYWLSGIATLPVAIELGIPFVQSFHTLGAMKNAAAVPGSEPEPDRRLWSERYLANQADAIIAVSAAEATQLIDVVGAPADKLWVIPPGVDTGFFTPAKTSRSIAAHAYLGIASDRPILSVVGRVQPLKGQDLAIRAFAQLSQPRPLLAIVGEPAPGAESYLDSLRALAAELGVSADVRFLGTLDRIEVTYLLANSALTLVPSYTESFGLVALEAAASGTPVVAMAVGGLGESVLDGETGVLVASRDAGEWARVIQSLLDDAPLRATLGAAGRAHAEGLGWGTAATSVLGVYASLVGRP